MQENTKKLISYNPSNGEVIWSGWSTSSNDIDICVNRAKSEQKKWKKTPISERQDIIKKFAKLVEKNAVEAANLISEENGKPLWEAQGEVKSLINKVQVVFDAYEERAKCKVKELANNRSSVTRFFPHGVMAVLGPFNFPMSMPNSHIMPSLYAGNTVVFKPSERTIKCAVFYRKLWIDAGLPKDALQIVFGDYEVGEQLVKHPYIKGVLFIGSRRAGKEIEKNAIENDKLCVLEMGGNSPLVIWDYSDVRAVINIIIQSAYISAGQRCSAARRIIINEKIYNELVPCLARAIDRIKVGDPFSTENPPFIGPMIDNKAVNNYIEQYRKLVDNGAKIIVASDIIKELGENFVKPGILDVTEIADNDEEIFGPLLQVIKAKDIEEAIEISNRTHYGLAAGIVTEKQEIYDYFLDSIEAGIVNWNQPLTGSTTIAPFGGIKGSGNYHPAGYLSVDYCSYGCASIESQTSCVPQKLSPGLDF